MEERHQVLWETRQGDAVRHALPFDYCITGDNHTKRQARMTNFARLMCTVASEEPSIDIIGDCLE
jgi:hypothetical protein